MRFIAITSCALMLGAGAPAFAQATLANVQERGMLNCQVGLPTPGFLCAGR